MNGSADRQRIGSNLLVMGAGQLITWAISAAYIVLIGRYLGPGRLGIFSLLISVVAVLGLFVKLGMDTFIVRTVARQPERASALVATSAAVRGLLGLPVLGIVCVYAHLTHLDAATAAAAFLLTVAMIISSWSRVLTSAFQGLEQMSHGVHGSILGNVLSLVLGGVAIASHGGVLALSAATLVTNLLVLAFYAWVARRYLQRVWRVSWIGVSGLVGGSLAFWANSAFLTFYTYVDAAILATVAGPRAAGYYAPPARILGVAMFLPTILGTAAMPLLSRLGVESGDRFARVGRKMLCLLIACSVPLAMCLATVPGPVISTFFGPTYRPSAAVLVVLALCIPWTCLDIHFAQMLAARSQQLRWSLIMGASCLANPAINLMLIPFAASHWHNAALGSAAALLATDMLMALYGAVVLRGVVVHGEVGRVLGGTLLAGAAQGLVIWLVAARSLGLAELLGLSVYAVLAITLRSLPRHELALLANTALRRLHTLPT